MDREAVRTQQNMRRPSGRRKKVDPGVLGLLRLVMMLLGSCIVVLGLLLLILPTLRVKNLVVEGNRYYSAEQIIAGAQIAVGDELLALDANAAANRVADACPYVQSVRISSRSLFTLCITVVEKENLMYTAFNDSYIVFDSSFRVLRQVDMQTPMDSLLYVELPPIAALTVGGTIHFVESDMNMDYVEKLLQKMEEKGILPLVSSVDFSKKYQVSYIMDRVCRVELGKVSELDTKMALVHEILESKGGLANCAVVDVSSTVKPTYRVVSAGDLLLQ